MGMDPPRWLQAGDVGAQSAIDGIGQIENRFVE
jgi:2-keto-4-pentenoate hydratase/2-oxohepta-3-ene-1,7-dioic acid hydratase in catechol pathway